MASPFAALPRVACPACGAAIHPIAGRCRHCRVDLAQLRADGAPPPAAIATAATTVRRNAIARAATSRAMPAPARARPRGAFVAALLVAIAVAAVVQGASVM